MIQFLLIK